MVHFSFIPKLIMSLFTIFQISSQGMTAQRERLETAAANLANSNTTRTAEGGPYRRRDVVFESVEMEKPGARASGSFGTFFESLEQPAQGVRSTTVESGQSEGIMRYQPDHPD